MTTSSDPIDPVRIAVWKDGRRQLEPTETMVNQRGLAVTRAKHGEKGWQVTHVRSGYKVMGPYPLRTARIACLLLLETVEGDGTWDQSRTNLMNRSGYYKRVAQTVLGELRRRNLVPEGKRWLT